LLLAPILARASLQKVGAALARVGFWFNAVDGSGRGGKRPLETVTFQERSASNSREARSRMRSDCSPQRRASGSAGQRPPERRGAAARSLTRRALAAVMMIAALASCSAQRAQPAESAATPATAASEPAPAGDATAPGTAQQGAPGTVDAALADLSRAEGELGRAFETLSEREGRKSPSGMPAPSTTGSPATPSPSPGIQPKTPGEEQLGVGDPCVTACRALASMQRATEHLCGLTGDGDQRCSGARERVRGARERVEGSCTCGPPGQD
jgi:hypothetical protein